MTKRQLLLGAALVSLPIGGGLAIGNASKPATDEQSERSVEKGYVCPATGEVLACPNCCPLNK